MTAGFLFFTKSHDEIFCKGAEICFRYKAKRRVTLRAYKLVSVGFLEPGFTTDFGNGQSHHLHLAAWDTRWGPRRTHPSLRPCPSTDLYFRSSIFFVGWPSLEPCEALLEIKMSTPSEDCSLNASMSFMELKQKQR